MGKGCCKQGQGAPESDGIDGGTAAPDLLPPRESKDSKESYCEAGEEFSLTGIEKEDACCSTEENCDGMSASISVAHVGF